MYAKGFRKSPIYSPFLIEYSIKIIKFTEIL